MPKNKKDLTNYGKWSISLVMESIAEILNHFISAAGMLGAFFLGAYVHSLGRDALPFGLKKFGKRKRMTAEREIEIEQGVPHFREDAP